MRISFTIFVLSIACLVAAVSAGVYPTKTTAGGSKSHGHSKGGRDAKKQHEDDRFHLQSPDGQYVFGHTTGTEGRAEIRDKNGTVTGYYSYVDGDGRVAYVNYVADEHGYRVLSNTGVPSASVTIEGNGDESAGSGVQKDFGKVFADFTKRIKGKIIERSGQKVIDPISGDGQYPVDPIVFPTKETKPSKHGETGQFPDWDQAKNAAANPEPTMTIKGGDDDGQQSNNKDWSVTTTEMASKKYVPINPEPPQVPTKGGNRIGGYSDVVVPEGGNVEETITEIVNARTGTESAVIDDTENSSPVTKPVSIVNNVQTTMSYDDDAASKTPASSVARGDFQTTIAPGVKRIGESSTAWTVPESQTEHYLLQTVTVSDDDTVKVTRNEIPFGTEVVPTTGGPLRDNGPSAAENLPATDYRSTVASVNRWSDDGGVYTTIGAADESVETVTNTAAYRPRVTTFQPAVRVGDAAETLTTVAGIRRYDSVTGRDEDGFDYRTVIGPTERIGTTMNPGQTEAQELEIVWPEIPQEPVPQVLVPLDPYAEGARPKNAGVKTHSIGSRPARHYYDSVDGKSPTANATTAASPSVNNDENTTESFFPKYFFIG